MARFARLLLIAGCGIILGNSVFARTYYIDYSGGSDKANGTSRTTDWQHLPGMPGCEASCAAASPRPGDKFILRGGVTWPNSSLGWEWIWSGNSSGSIYIGVDESWYAGSSWARPVFNGGGAVIPTWKDGNKAPVFNLFFAITANYVVLDSIEWTGFYEHYTGHYGQDGYIGLHYNSTNLEIKNNYFHGWTHTPYGGTSQDGGLCITGDSSWPSGNANSSIHDNVFDGSDTAGDSMEALHGGPEAIYNNYVNNMSNGFVGEYTLVHDNVVQNINASYNPTMHENGLEINFSGTAYVYNNVFAHVRQGLAIWLAPNQGATHYFYNNLVYDIPLTNVVDLAASLQSCCGNIVSYNNTVECGVDGAPAYVCFGGIASGIAAVKLANNHVITNATAPNKGMWFENGNTPVTESNNIVMSYGTGCTKQGYCSSSEFPFSPKSTSSGTVGKGANLKDQCPKLPGLCNDTTLGVAYHMSSHTVSYPARTPNPRPATGAWDAGAYQFKQPSAPTI